MNKILTLLVGCSAICFSGFSYAEHPVTEQQKQMAKNVANKGIEIKYIRKNAPSHYVVKSGDTLWGISSKFLTTPSLWPALWGANKDKIVNPHLIYPGQNLYLIKKDGYAYLSTSPDGSQDTIKLSPKMRMGEVESKNIPVIPESVLRAFSVKPMVLRVDEIKASGRIVAGEPSSKRIFSNGDVIYTRGEPSGHDTMNLFRPAKPIYNPEFAYKEKKEPQDILAYEAEFIAKAVKLPETKGDIRSFKVFDTSKEVETGDIVLPPQPEPNYNLQIVPAPKKTKALVAKVYGESEFGAKGFVIVINKGSSQGIKSGYVLQIVKQGKIVTDTTNAFNPKEKIELPNRAAGFAIVFAVHNNVSYGFISESDEGIEVGDSLIAEGDKI
ncbi:MAG: putative peptidoglycan binding protein LysM domain [Pseudomonadota bacterium]|jgi:LysM repeat protein